MTLAEHKLMITMFTRQAMLLKTLTDVLKSHKLVSDDDIKAFDAFQQTMPAAVHAFQITAAVLTSGQSTRSGRSCERR